MNDVYFNLAFDFIGKLIQIRAGLKLIFQLNNIQKVFLIFIWSKLNILQNSTSLKNIFFHMNIYRVFQK